VPVSTNPGTECYFEVTSVETTLSGEELLRVEKVTLHQSVWESIWFVSDSLDKECIKYNTGFDFGAGLKWSNDMYSNIVSVVRLGPPALSAAP